MACASGAHLLLAHVDFLVGPGMFRKALIGPVTLIDRPGTAPATGIAWQRGASLAMAFAVLGGFVPGIAMGLMQGAGEVGTPTYRMLAQLHGRMQPFGFANTLVLAVALCFLPRL